MINEINTLNEKINYSNEGIVLKLKLIQYFSNFSSPLGF